ncbi:MAG: hypothetical protein PVG56_11360 [Anaerolineae bacterium]|jgi:hypothetical protein
MREGTARPDLTILSGRFGSGKTETAINLALSLARDRGIKGARPSCPVILIDLDIVTPYFRSRETADRIRAFGVQVIAPSIIGQHLDTPAITPQILGAIQQSDRRVVLDVGGDKQGARALGQFSDAIRQRGYAMLFVVNPYRPFTDTLQGLADSVAEIQASARLEVTGLVSNPNLIGETSIEGIINGHAKLEGFAQALGLPIDFVCIERRWTDDLESNQFKQPMLTLDRHFTMSWE